MNCPTTKSVNFQTGFSDARVSRRILKDGGTTLVLASLAMTESSFLKIAVALLSLIPFLMAAELPTKKYLDLKTIKTLVAAAEAEAQRQNVSVTLCIVDESGNLLFLEKGETAALSTITWAQRKARHAAFYNAPSKDAEDTVKKGHVEALAYPEFFPNQGGLPVVVDGQLVGGMSASGAKSEIDEAIVRVALDSLTKK